MTLQGQWLLMGLLLIGGCGTRQAADSFKFPLAADVEGLTGSYVQEDNRLVKILIDLDQRVQTNLTIDLGEAGDGTRLTPIFPQRLVYFENLKSYKTTGYFNLPGSNFRNVELKADSYQDGQKLDISLIVEVKDSDFPDNSTESFWMRCHPRPRPPRPVPDRPDRPCPECESRTLTWTYHFIRNNQ